MQEAVQMGYGNAATDYTGISHDPLDDDAATRAFQQSLSELSATIGKKEQAHSAQQQRQVEQSATQQQMWSLQQSISMLQQQVANLAVRPPTAPPQQMPPPPPV